MMMIMMIKMMKRMMMLYKSLGNFCIGRFLGTVYIYTLRDFLLPYITPHYVSSHGEEQQSTFPGQSTAFPVCSHLVKEAENSCSMGGTPENSSWGRIPQGSIVIIRQVESIHKSLLNKCLSLKFL